MKFKLLLVFVLGSIGSCYAGKITVAWDNGSEPRVLESGFINPEKLKTFDQEHFQANRLPEVIDGQQMDGLKSELQDVVADILNGHEPYRHITVLKDRNFNRTMRTGLFIAQFQHYPFVLKFFRETPESFSKPFNKGWEPVFFFIMGGGMNRHLAGFTRVANAQRLEKPLLENGVKIPHKCYFPVDQPWITISDSGNKVITRFPSSYAIIAEKLIIMRPMSYFNSDDRARSLALCNTAQFALDPHIENFYIIQKATEHSPEVGIVDTEHFPTLVGISYEGKTYTNRVSFYKDMCFVIIGLAVGLIVPLIMKVVRVPSRVMKKAYEGAICYHY